MRSLIEEMSASRATLEAHADVQLRKIGAAVGRSIQALTEATDWLLTAYEPRPQQAAAGAVPFLKLTGTVVGGWLMARLALSAHARMDADDAEFRGAKLVSARYFAEHVLPEVQALRDAVVGGAESVLALPETLF